MTGTPIRLRRLDHVVLRVNDIDRSIAFYRDVLGCTMEKQQQDIGLYQLRAGDSLIDLVTADTGLGKNFPDVPSRDGPNMDHFCVQVDSWDVAAIRAHLRAHGVAAGEVEQRYGALGRGPSMYLNDPDGNIVELKGPPA